MLGAPILGIPLVVVVAIVVLQVRARILLFSIYAGVAFSETPNLHSFVSMRFNGPCRIHVETSGPIFDGISSAFWGLDCIRLFRIEENLFLERVHYSRVLRSVPGGFTCGWLKCFFVG